MYAKRGDSHLSLIFWESLESLRKIIKNLRVNESPLENSPLSYF